MVGDTVNIYKLVFTFHVISYQEIVWEICFYVVGSRCTFTRDSVSRFFSSVFY